MPDPVGHLTRSLLVAGLALAFPALAAAQQPVMAPRPAEVTVLPRMDFHLNAAALAASDDRFKWKAQFGGTMDLVDYEYGRLLFTGDYETILSNEARPFDPIQSLYTLEGGVSLRVERWELIGNFHHVSRHLSDRVNPFAVAWNEVALRALRRVEHGATALDVSLEGGRVVARAFVDYTWAGQANVTVRQTLSPKTALFTHGMVQGFDVNGEVPDRDPQVGGLAEFGVHFTGPGAAMELFAGVERRIDAYPLERTARHWALAGFRLLSR